MNYLSKKYVKVDPVDTNLDDTSTQIRKIITHKT